MQQLDGLINYFWEETSALPCLLPWLSWHLTISIWQLYWKCGHNAAFVSKLQKVWQKWRKIGAHWAGWLLGSWNWHGRTSLSPFLLQTPRPPSYHRHNYSCHSCHCFFFFAICKARQDKAFCGISSWEFAARKFSTTIELGLVMPFRPGWDVCCFQICN